MSQIRIRNVVKNFKDVEVLKNISLDIEDGSFTVLLGPSGCGKSTLLRIISGLESPTDGEVFIGGKNVTKVEPRDRNVAMVFQNYALYPHLTVYQNIEYGLKARKVKKEERRELIRQAVEMVRLEDQVSKRPAEMSGGQRQRVALARAIVKRPNVFLMDEPLSNLDAKLRSQMRVELLGLYNRLKTTFLYVTHDQVEAMSMGTKIVILDHGKIQQIGTSKEIYEEPANIFVAGFIGAPPANIIDMGKHRFAIRPEHILLKVPEKDMDDYIVLDGQVMSTENLGYETIFNVHTKMGDLRVKGQSTWVDYYTTVRLYIQVKKMLHFDAQGQRITGTSLCNDAAEYFNKYIAAKDSACAADSR